MLYRKIESLIEEHLKSGSKKVLLSVSAGQSALTQLRGYAAN